MSLLVAFAIIGAVLAGIAIFRAKGDNLAAWAALAIAAGIILTGVR